MELAWRWQSVAAATPTTPDNATQVLVARLDNGYSFLVCSQARRLPCGWCQVDADQSWKSSERLAGASWLACADLGGDLQVAVGQRGGVEGAVGGGEAGGSAVDDAVEAGRGRAPVAATG